MRHRDKGESFRAYSDFLRSFSEMYGRDSADGNGDSIRSSIMIDDYDWDQTGTISRLSPPNSPPVHDEPLSPVAEEDVVDLYHRFLEEASLSPATTRPHTRPNTPDTRPNSVYRIEDGIQDIPIILDGEDSPTGIQGVFAKLETVSYSSHDRDKSPHSQAGHIDILQNVRRALRPSPEEPAERPTSHVASLVIPDDLDDDVSPLKLIQLWNASVSEPASLRSLPEDAVLIDETVRERVIETHRNLCDMHRSTLVKLNRRDAYARLEGGQAARQTQIAKQNFEKKLKMDTLRLVGDELTAEMEHDAKLMLDKVQESWTVYLAQVAMIGDGNAQLADFVSDLDQKQERLNSNVEATLSQMDERLASFSELMDSSSHELELLMPNASFPNVLVEDYVSHILEGVRVMNEEGRKVSKRSGMIARRMTQMSSELRQVEMEGLAVLSSMTDAMLAVESSSRGPHTRRKPGRYGCSGKGDCK